MLFELCGEVFVVTEIWDEGIREAFYAFLLQRKERLQRSPLSAENYGSWFGYRR